jgi:hypothetical protein
MADQVTKTETVHREYDDGGNLTQEVTTTIVTRVPAPGKPPPPFGFQSPEVRRR